MDNKKKRIESAVIMTYLGLVIAVFLVIGVIHYRDNFAKPYEQAIEYIYAGKYEEALELLTPLSYKEFSDSKDLRDLCSGILEYEQGELERAWYRFEDLDYLVDLTAEENARFDEFRSALEEEYKAYREAYQKAERIAEQKATELKIATGVPYVGMSESRGDETTKTTTYDDDPYDAAGYRNAEDFYDDNYDNFFCYEDAETYYRKHHD